MNSMKIKVVLLLCVLVTVTFIVITSKMMLVKNYKDKPLSIKARDWHGNITAYLRWQQQNNTLSFCPEVPPGLNVFLKTATELASLMSDGRVFRSFGAACMKLLSPNFTKRLLATTSDTDLLADRNSLRGNDVQPEERWKAFKDDPSVLQHVQLGGSYKPSDCRAKQHTAIIIPFRDREEHLRKFLIHIHQFLKKQQLHYRVFVAEMTNSTQFNTGLMQNVGFVTADNSEYFTCFIIHDVDLLPTNENNFYKCEDKMVVLLAPNNSKFEYKPLYDKYLGGAIALTRDQFNKTNGYSNIYFGWGGQDDDFELRVSDRGIPVKKAPMSIGVVKALPHDRDKGNQINPKRSANVLSALKRIDKDGLNTLQYKIIKHELKDLYTWILVEVDRQQVMKGWE